MSQPRRKRSGQRGAGQGKQRPPVDIWRAEPLPDVKPISVPEEVGALLRSLGDPPPIGGSVIASQYFIAVAERAAAVATALALSVDLLATPGDESSS
jgi:hypothetical protein